MKLRGHFWIMISNNSSKKAPIVTNTDRGWKIWPTNGKNVDVEETSYRLGLRTRMSMVLVNANAGSGWLQVFPCTDKSSTNVLRCLRTIFSRFGATYTVLFDKGKEFVSEDLKEWLTAQVCYKSDTLLYSTRSNGLGERAVRTLKRGLNSYNKNVGCSLGTYIDEINLIIEIFEMLEELHQRRRCLDEAYGTQPLDSMIMV